jgi:hypothetical protein
MLLRDLLKLSQRKESLHYMSICMDILEKRTFLFFWENVYIKRSPFIGFYETYEAALQDIKDRVKKENTVEYIYNFD